MKLEPGIHHDIPLQDYFAIDAVNASRLKLLDRSPAHYHHYAPRQQTPALAFGSVCHTALLEQGAFGDRYVVLPAFENDEANVTQAGKATTSKATKYYRDKVAEFLSHHEGKEIISAEDRRRAWDCTEACRDNQRAADLLQAPGHAEVTVVWQETVKTERRDVTFPCKARFDKLITGDDALRLTGGESDYLIVDLKTTADLSEFGTSIARYRYDLQLEFYQFGLLEWLGTENEIGITAEIIAVETEAPYMVHAAPVDTTRAASDLPRLLFLLAECIDQDDWPAPYTPGDPWNLPSWFLPKPTAPTLTAGGKPLSI